MVMTRSKYFMSAFSEYGYRLHIQPRLANSQRLAVSRLHTQPRPANLSLRSLRHYWHRLSTHPTTRVKYCISAFSEYGYRLLSMSE